MTQKEKPVLDELITSEEREHLLFGLHRFLAWVGEPLPEKVEADGEKIEIHDLIWRCIHNKEFSEKEKKVEIYDIYTCISTPFCPWKFFIP